MPRTVGFRPKTREANTHPKVADIVSPFSPWPLDAKSRPAVIPKSLGNAQLLGPSDPKLTHSIPTKTLKKNINRSLASGGSDCKTKDVLQFSVTLAFRREHPGSGCLKRIPIILKHSLHA